MNWTKLYCLDKEKAKYSGPGIYRVRLYKNGAPIPIKRLQGKDGLGILSIGKSVNIDKRIKLFQSTSVGNRSKGHSEARTWFIVSRIPGSQYDDCDLMFEYFKSDKIEFDEREALKKYFIDHLELPPLNHQFPGRMEWYKKLKEEKD